MKHSTRRRRLSSFTLVELLVVVAIIALLLNLSFPALRVAIQKAQSIKCSSNLHQIGVAVTLAASDNNNIYPEINQVANANPSVYPASVPGLVGVLGPYGITTNAVQCPSDLALGAAASCNNTAYPNSGSSYEWNPAFDDENPLDTVLYLGTRTIQVSSAHVRLCTDFQPLHHNKMNALYSDGHVTAR